MKPSATSNPQRIQIPPTRGRLPAEWERQDGVQLTWPSRESAWGAAQRSRVEQVFLDIATAIARFERVLIVVENGQEQQRLLTRLREQGADSAAFRWVVSRSNDVWARDHGPLTVLRGDTPVLLDFHFNGWGGKYAYQWDDQITATAHAAAAFGEVRREEMDFVLEGGSIETNGLDTVLTTESCLLSPARNPKMSRQDIERELTVRFGVGRILWLRHGGLAGDDTDGHIDTLARFCAQDHIAYVACSDPSDEHYQELQAMAEELAALRTPAGAPYRLTALPWPRAKLNAAGERLPATYANFLIINGAVLVPLYDDPADETALAVIAQCFPERQVVGIRCLPLIEQFGSLHCVTMQLPAGSLP